MGNNANQYACVDGAFLAAHEPAVSVESRGLMYGDGCFETFSLQDGHPRLLDEHLQRLQKGLSYIGIAMPDNCAPDQLRSHISTLCTKNRCAKGRAVGRLQVWRSGGRGFLSNSSEPRFSLQISAAPKQPASCSVATVAVRRTPDAALPSFGKWSNSLNYIMAARQAHAREADLGLMLTVDDVIAETDCANIFWVNNNTVFTPDASCDILPGITRGVLLRLLKKMNIPITTGRFSHNQLLQAQSIWVCNSVKGVLPVHRLDEQTFSTEASIVDSLQQKYHSFMQSSEAVSF